MRLRRAPQQYPTALAASSRIHEPSPRMPRIRLAGPLPPRLTCVFACAVCHIHQRQPAHLHAASTTACSDCASILQAPCSAAPGSTPAESSSRYVGAQTCLFQKRGVVASASAVLRVRLKNLMGTACRYFGSATRTNTRIDSSTRRSFPSSRNLLRSNNRPLKCQCTLVRRNFRCPLAAAPPEAAGDRAAGGVVETCVSAGASPVPS